MKAHCSFSEVLNSNWMWYHAANCAGCCPFIAGTFAPRVRLFTFYGRSEESAVLEQWIVDDRCRLVAVLWEALAKQLYLRKASRADQKQVLSG